MEIVPRFFQSPRQSFFLFGPRGTGKSTLLESAFPDSQRLDLLRPELYRSLKAKPERLRDYALAAGTSVLVLDEVQRVPELLPVVHGLMEGEGRDLQYVLTGSSARKLRSVGNDLLGGRALFKTLHPFMAAELPTWSLQQGLSQGQLPIVWGRESAEEVLQAYLAVYMEQEVKSEGIVRNLPAFARFLETVSFSHGAQLNAAEIGRELGVSRNTVASYLEILEDLLLAFRVPVFTKHAKRHLVSHQKFYYFDVGVYRAVRPKGVLDRPEEIEGGALEGLVAEHLRAFLAYTGRGVLYYWRTKAGTEVDFVVYGDDLFWAIEVKNSGEVRGRDLAGLKTFQLDYPQAHCFLLYRGEERFKRDGVECMLCDSFLRNLRPADMTMASIAASGRRGDR